MNSSPSKLSTTSTASPPRRRLRYSLPTALVGVLVAAGVSVSPASAQATPLPADCVVKPFGGTDFIQCTITESGAATLDEMVPAGILPSAGDPVVLTAHGGDGATLPGDNGGRSGGDGGNARTVIDADEIAELHTYIGQDAATGSRHGGSATIVSTKAIEDVGSVDETLLIAGGGGAQGARMDCGPFADGWNGAGSGGAGGVTDATEHVGVDGFGAGKNGGPGSDTFLCSSKKGHTGTGGHLGEPGTNAGDSRSNGIAGIGGHGGENGWQGGVSAAYEAGRGGITSVYAMGGG
ncbi:MAG: hypothetical protein WBV89_02205, partial [Ilumatobacter sp.]